jgi:hypothetical protein
VRPLSFEYEIHVVFRHVIANQRDQVPLVLVGKAQIFEENETKPEAVTGIDVGMEREVGSVPSGAFQGTL